MFATSAAPSPSPFHNAVQRMGMVRGGVPRSGAPAAFVRRVESQQGSSPHGSSFTTFAAVPAPATAAPAAPPSSVDPLAAFVTSDAGSSRQRRPEAVPVEPVAQIDPLAAFVPSKLSAPPAAASLLGSSCVEHRKEVREFAPGVLAQVAEPEAAATPYEVSLAQREAQWLSGAAELLRCADELALGESQSEGPASFSGTGMPGFGMTGVLGRQRKMEEVLQRRLKTLRFLAEQQAVLSSHLDGKAAAVPDEEQQVSEARRRLSEEAHVLAQRASRLAEAQARLADAEQQSVQEVQARQSHLAQRQEEIDECSEALDEFQARYAEQEVLLADMRRKFAEAEVEAASLQAERVALDTHRQEVELREASLRCLELGWEKAMQQGIFLWTDQDTIVSLGAERLASELLSSEPYLQRLHKLVDSVVRAGTMTSRDEGRSPGTLAVSGSAPGVTNGRRPEADEAEEAEGASAEASTAYVGEEEEEAELREESSLRWEVVGVSAIPPSALDRSGALRQESASSSASIGAASESGGTERLLLHSPSREGMDPALWPPSSPATGSSSSPQLLPTMWPSPGQSSGRLPPSPGFPARFASVPTLRRKPASQTGFATPPGSPGLSLSVRASPYLGLYRPPPVCGSPARTHPHRTASAPPETPRQFDSIAGLSQALAPMTPAFPEGFSQQPAALPAGIATTDSLIAPWEQPSWVQTMGVDEPSSGLSWSPPPGSNSAAYSRASAAATTAALIAATRRPIMSPLASSPRPESPTRGACSSTATAQALGFSTDISGSPRPAPAPWRMGLGSMPAATLAASTGNLAPQRSLISPSPRANATQALPQLGTLGSPGPAAFGSAGPGSMMMSPASGSSSVVPAGVQPAPGHVGMQNQPTPTPQRLGQHAWPGGMPGIGMPGSGQPGAGNASMAYGAASGLQGLGFGAQPPAHFNFGAGVQAAPGGSAGMLRRPVMIGGMRS